MTTVPTDLEREHWDFSTSLVVWTFELPRSPGESSQSLLRRQSLAALVAVAPFANINRIEWITASSGDDAAELRPDGAVDVAAATAIFDGLPDVVELSALLDLRCTSSEQIEFTIPQGGVMRLLFVDADGAEEERLVLELGIHSDIYSPVTNGHVRENTRLARLNAPRLSEFLRNIREGMGG